MSQTFNFEYTRTGVLVALVIGCIALAFAIAFMLPDLGYFLNVNVNALVGVGIGILIIYFNRHLFKKSAEAVLEDDRVLLKFEENEIDIQFQNLQYYKIEYGNGVILSLKMIDEPAIKFTANSNFCNDLLLNDFCVKLEKKLLAYKTEYSGQLERKPSFFEQKWVLYFLLVSTGIIIFLTYQSLNQTGKISPSIITNFFVFSGLWSAWFAANIKKE